MQILRACQNMQSCFFSLWRHCGHLRTWTRFPVLGVVPAVNAPPTLLGHLGLQSVPALCWRFGGQSVLNHQTRRQIKCLRAEVLKQNHVRWLNRFRAAYSTTSVTIHSGTITTSTIQTRSVAIWLAGSSTSTSEEPRRPS